MSKQLDINGKESAKRAWASRMLWSVLGIFWAYALLWAYTIIKDKLAPNMPDALIQMWFGLAGGGLAALGFTLAERFKQGAQSKSIPGGGVDTGDNG